ncbi:MAG: ThuA domain-containing protein, partial [Solirubrobacteraceae bacterium]
MGRTRVVLLAFVVALVCGLWSAAAARAQEPGTLENVLVFSKTGGFRHDSIPQGIVAIQQLGAANGFTVTATEDAAQFTDANLANYDVVVFLSTTGEVLDDAQQAAFERFIQAGGGYAGIHAASDTEYSWPWYGELVGGYFRTHPPGTPTATVEIEDADEPSTTGLPASWTRVDEWYNFQHPTTPAVNGSSTIADFSPRARHVKVLATVDESTYGEEDGNTADDDHPVAWCSRFDGGISWYTAMGHTQASFAEPEFRAHLLGGLRTAAGVAGDCGEPRSMPPTADVFEKVTLDNETKAPMEIAIAEDGRVFYIELGQPVTGGQANQASAELMVWDPDTQAPSVAGTLTVDNSHENGLLGVTLAPDFAVTGHLYMSYSKLGVEPVTAKVNRLSRFTIGADNQIVAGSEVPIYEWTHQRQECCHTGGSLDFGPDGSIYISTGDNTNPFAHGYNPTDERPGRMNWDAQRTSANTNSPNGKILRIVPRAAPLGPPGVGTTYDIPTGNMFAPGTAQTLPEIYAMGFRNPFRIHVDPVTNWVFMGDYGPDAGSTNPVRGPQGSVEFNIVKEPGFYGWPYCVRENVPYHDITYTSDAGAGTDNGLYNCAAPVNNSPNNTGLTNLPAAKPATMWMGYTETDVRFPDLGTGGAPTGGTVYRYDEDSDSTTKFPRFYDGQWFIGEWNNDWIKTATWNDAGLATGVSCFAICDGYISPMDIEFGPDGSMYVVEWGQGFAENNPDSGVYRVDYVQGSRLPIAQASVTPDGGPVPLDVTFSSAGSRDPDGTPITYAWDFGDGGTSTDPNPTHTYTTAGTYQARLTVTDESGATSTDSVTVNAGNTRPVVTIDIPENGKVADFGDTIPYEVSVTDAEDGSTGSGISCDNVRIEFKLGHDTHAHELSSDTGCSGEFTLNGIAGHGIDANIFTVITAAYTDRGAGTAGPLTGTGEVILQPKLKQAEFYSTTGRTDDGAPTGVGTPGVQLEATTDVGAGNAAAFIEDGDWISFNPYNLEDLDKVTFRVASGGAGGTIQLKFDDPNGPAFAETPNIAPTGGWQTWTDVTMDLPDTVPDGTHRLFVVFRNATVDEGLMNLNWFRFSGKGAAVTAPPEVTAAAEPATGDAPLDVSFDAEATDAEGEALTYAWDFGVSGTTADTSTDEDPTYTYQNPGTYTATVTVTDASGGRASASVEVRATRPQEQCPTGPVRSDEFDGTSLDTGRWTVLRPDTANPFSVSGGSLNLPIANGSMYGPGTSAKNLIVQPVPDAGAWTVTAKITAPNLTENYHQAGLRLWSDDDNWASVHRIFAGSGKDVEFIYENDGQPRNEPADKLGGIPADAPATYYVRLHSNGTDVTASYSTDGQQFAAVGRPAPLSAFGANLQVGPAALSDLAPSVPMASFDWIQFDPDGSGGGGETVTDDFDGTMLGAPWAVTRQDQGLVVNGGTLQIPAVPGDVYQTRNDARNLALRPAPNGPWTATTKLNFEGTTQYHQAGIMVYGTDDNFTKFGRIAHTTAGDEKFEFINEVNAVARNEAADSTGNLDAAFPDDFWLRLTSDGTNVVGHYSTDGSSWTAVGRPAALPANAKIGLFAFSNDGAGNPIAAFDSFTLSTPGSGGGGGGGTPSGPSYDDEFDGSSLDTDRWNAIVRPASALTAVSGGKLNLTTSPGDIYTGDTNPPPGNFILQDASHADADWTIETKIDSATINGGYKQGGLLAHVDGDNYVKFDAISDVDNTRINRLELRSEVAGVIGTSPADPLIAAGVTDIWLRLTKTGNSYAGEYSLDGTAWTALASPVTNGMAEPDFGLFAIAPQAQGNGTLVPFEYFMLDGPDPVECGCVSSGDEFDGTSLDKATWNAIVRDDATRYAVADGALTVTTVPGEIYRAGTGGGTLVLQSADHAGADFVLETTLSGTITTGYSQAGIMVHADDDNYVKFNAISDDGANRINRVELRSEVAGVVPDGGPEFGVPAGTTKIGLRLTKAGTAYTGEVSFDGGAWQALPAGVTNAMVTPRFGLYTAGVNDSGDTITFDSFKVDGKTGCPGEEPENAAPVLGDPTATPTSGMAPLDVDFAAAATDADEDELTYSWEFGDGGTSAEQNPSHT